MGGLREGATVGNLGNAYAHLGEVEKAIGYYGRALVISREIGDPRIVQAVTDALENLSKPG